MGREKRLAEVGSFCPNQECPDYGLVAAGNSIKYGFGKRGRQRYRCNSCERAFDENHGTLFYRRRNAAKEILECLALLAEGTTPFATQRDNKGRLQRILPRAFFGDEQELRAIVGAHTTYIERSHRTMRQDNCRRARKSLSFSRARRHHEAAIIWEDAAYNMIKPPKSLRLGVRPQAEHLERRYQHRTPAMVAGVIAHAWSYDELLRTITVPSPSDAWGDSQ